MPKKKLRTYIKLEKLVKDYGVKIINYKRKTLGVDYRNNPIDFTPEEKAAIKKAALKMVVDCMDNI